MLMSDLQRISERQLGWHAERTHHCGLRGALLIVLVALRMSVSCFQYCSCCSPFPVVPPHLFSNLINFFLKNEILE